MKNEIEVANSTITSRIITIRGVQAILDWDIAELYGVETRVLNQAVKRNIERFPDRFRFVLTKSELNELITNCDKSQTKRHYPGTPAAFTEQGVAMLSAILRSPTAIEVSIRIMDEIIMINYQFFPRSHGLTKEMEQIVDCFKAVDVAKKPEEQFSSNHMLSLVRAEKVLINKRNVENYQVFHYEA